MICKKKSISRWTTSKFYIYP